MKIFTRFRCSVVNARWAVGVVGLEEAYFAACSRRRTKVGSRFSWSERWPNKRHFYYIYGLYLFACVPFFFPQVQGSYLH